MKKSSIKRWFRYHHYHTHPALENHSKFINCLETVESYEADRVDEYKEFSSSGNADKDWKQILDAINNLSEDELEHLSRLIKTRDI